jgi:hypothetical protein
MEPTALLTALQITQVAARFFGQPIVKMTAPGGRSRRSFRLYFADRTVIVSQRHRSDKSEVERRVLTALGAATDSVPRFLGTSEGLVFQSDVGAERLNWLIHTLPVADRLAVAAKAVQALFDIQRAAVRVGLRDGMPTASLVPTHDDDLIWVARRMAVQLNHRDLAFDPDRLSPWFRRVPQAFVKWDCRAGNAALGTDGHVRWFEDARLAQGPEDFASLIADESWPIDGDAMLALVKSRLTPENAPDPQSYMTYLEEFSTLQALRRIRLIFSEAKRRGWMDRVSILKFDKVGTNPHMGERLCVLRCSNAPPMCSAKSASNRHRSLRHQIDWWCPRSDSNRHASRRRILSPLRLPFHHSGTAGDLAAPRGGVNHLYQGGVHQAVNGFPHAIHGVATRNVSQSDNLPDVSPILNHFARCADVPWVKLSGIGTCPALRCNVSSPICFEALIASS